MGTDAPPRFFFYGTLIAGAAPVAEPLRGALSKLRELGPAQVSGTIHAIPDPQGWYPAMLAGPGTVAGRI